MYLLGAIALLLIAGAVFGMLRSKRTNATESNASYRRGMTGQ